MAISKTLKYIQWSSSFQLEECSPVTFFIEAKDSPGTNNFFLKESFETILEAVEKRDQQKPDSREIEIKAIRETSFTPSSAIVLDEIYAQDMFALSRVLVITAPASWVKSVAEELEKLITKPPENTYLLFCVNSLDARTKLAKLVAEKSVMVEFPRMFDAPPSWSKASDSSDNDYTRWIVNRARRYNKIISLHNAMLILSIVGTNLKTIDNQLNTLSIYDNHNKEIKEEHIRAVIRQPAGISIFKVIDSVMNANLGEALALTRRMFIFGLAAEGGKLDVDESSILNYSFIPNLFRRFKRVIDIMCLVRKGHSVKDAAEALGIPSYFISTLESDLRSYNKMSQLENAINVLMDADIRSKTTSPSIPWLAEEIVLKICGNRA
jgi:DNA polymerase III delta subunit